MVNPNPNSFWTKVYGNSPVAYTATEMQERDRQQASKTYTDYEKHIAEINQRLKWCVQNKHWPADQHLDLAPGDDTQFMVKQWWPVY